MQEGMEWGGFSADYPEGTLEKEFYTVFFQISRNNTLGNFFDSQNTHVMFDSFVENSKSEHAWFHHLLYIYIYIYIYLDAVSTYNVIMLSAVIKAAYKISVQKIYKIVIAMKYVCVCVCVCVCVHSSSLAHISHNNSPNDYSF